MTTRNHLTIIAIILLFMNIYLLILLRTNRLKSEMLIKTHQEKRDKDQIILESVKISNKLLYSLSTFSEIENLSILTEDGDSVLLKSTLNNEYTLIFRYNEFCCNSCVYNEINTLNLYADSIDCDILILVSYDNKRNFL